MAFTGPVEDRLLIRELMGSYADVVFRWDKDVWLACWAEAVRSTGTLSS